jgi:hypothetical protein
MARKSARKSKKSRSRRTRRRNRLRFRGGSADGSIIAQAPVAPQPF